MTNSPNFAGIPPTTLGTPMADAPHCGTSRNLVVLSGGSVVASVPAFPIVSSLVPLGVACGQHTIGVLPSKPHVELLRYFTTAGSLLWFSRRLSRFLHFFMLMQVPYVWFGVSHGTPSET